MTPARASPAHALNRKEEPPVQAERDAPVYAADQIEIAADPATIWDTLTDIPAWGDWMPAVRSIAAAEPLAVGARFREKSGLVTMRSQVVQVDPPRALARIWKVSGLRTEAIEHWSLEQRDGITLARTEQSWRGPLPRLLPGPMRTMLAQTIHDRLNALKTEAERRAAGRSLTNRPPAG
jgi:Polyketide cyclase / dehydrase and lipid transport